LLGLDGEAVEYVVVLVACDLDDFADEDSVGTDDIPARLDLQPRDRISHARSTPDRRAETSAGTRSQATNQFDPSVPLPQATPERGFVSLKSPSDRHGHRVV
jgi:hypothetical protein